MIAAPGLGLGDALLRIEGRLASACELRATPLARHLSAASGEWRGTPVSLAARASRSAFVRYARAVHIAGGDLEIANLFVLPDPLLDVPMLGIDLVQMRRAEALIVADLLPPSPSATGLQTARAVPLPEWCLPYFSADVLVARVTPLDAAVALARVEQVVERFIATLDSAVAAPAGARARRRHQDEYSRVHRNEDRALGLLGRMFGDEWAEEFTTLVLFPAGSAGDAQAGETIAELRAACRIDHDRLEAAVDLMRDDVSLGDYARFLEASAACVAPLERAIAELTARAGDRLGPARLGKTAWLETDLGALGRRLPRPATVPRIDDWADAFGCAYVLEGATLGGQVLARHLARTPGTAGAPVRYLRGYGAETGPMWRAFLDRLTAFMAEDPIRARKATQAARATFAAFAAAISTTNP